MGTKKTLFLLLSVVMALALVLLIPLDFFYHGFYCEPIAYGNISEEDLLSTVDVSQEAYTTTFSPQEKRFAGFEVFIADLPEDTAGELVFTTYNQKGEMLESLEAEISTMYENTWYIITTGEEYQVGQVYQLQISARNCTEAPRLQLVDNGYLQEESLDGPAGAFPCGVEHVAGGAVVWGGLETEKGHPGGCPGVEYNRCAELELYVQFV